MSDTKIVILGETGTGKSSITIRFTMDVFYLFFYFFQNTTVIDRTYSKVITLDNRPLHLQIALNNSNQLGAGLIQSTWIFNNVCYK